MALGEQAPKSLAIRAPRVLVLLTAPAAGDPVVHLLAGDLAVEQGEQPDALGPGPGPYQHGGAGPQEEELRLIVAESVAGGHLSRNERMMIENVLNLEEKTARRVMVPRPDIVYLSLARPLEDNLRLARQAGHTRFPLCEDDLTTVIGMIHVKDIFRSGSYQNGRVRPAPARRKVPFLPVTLRLDQLLLEFQRNRVHLAMLLDEYGSVVGMVTLENVLEELVGPDPGRVRSRDAADHAAGRECLRGRRRLPARRPGRDLSEWRSPRPTPRPPAGWSSTCSAGWPGPATAVSINGHRLTVLRADPTRIRKIRVEPAASEAPATPPEGPQAQADEANHTA